MLLSECLTASLLQECHKPPGRDLAGSLRADLKAQVSEKYPGKAALGAVANGWLLDVHRGACQQAVVDFRFAAIAVVQLELEILVICLSFSRIS